MSSTFLDLAISILSLGSLYGLLAIGFALSFNLAKFFDLSHGASFLVGGYLGFQSYAIWHFGFLQSVLVASIGAGLFGLLVERGVISYLQRRSASPLVLFIATLGILIFVQNGLGAVFGADTKVYSQGPAWAYDFGFARLSWIQLLEITLCVLFLTVVTFVMKTTRLGRRYRAISDDPKLASLVGVPIGDTALFVSVGASALSGLAGFIFGFDRTLDPSTGLFAVLAAMIPSIVGGVGSVPGAMVGAFLLAFVETVSVTLFPGLWKQSTVYALLILFLSARPGGLFANRLRTA